jgi:hypothetical protein
VIIDLKGSRFANLVVADRTDSDRYGRTRWRCVCDCGNEVVVGSNNLRTGNTKSCGCRKHAGPNKTHGMSNTPTHRSWLKMLERCENPKSNRFAYYGGRAIRVCPRWKSFENFLSDMGPRPERKTLDRIDVNGNYEPGNCRWATAKEQRANRQSA